MLASCLRWSCNHLGRSRESIHLDRSRLRTAVETNAASGAIMSGITRGMNAVMAEFRRKLEALERAGLDAEPASFALFDIHYDFAARRTGHNLLLVSSSQRQPPAPLADAAATWSSRSIPTGPHGSRDAQSRSAPWRVREPTCRADTPHHVRSLRSARDHGT